MKTTFADSYVNWLIKESGPVTADELRYALKKHEGRETPDQEDEESEKEQDIERRAGIHEKTAAWGGFSKLAKKKLPVSGKASPSQRGSLGEQLDALGLTGQPAPKPAAKPTPRQTQGSAPSAAAVAGKWSTGKKALVGVGTIGLVGTGAYLYKKHKDKKMAETGQTKAAFWRGFEKRAGLFDGNMNVKHDLNPEAIRRLGLLGESVADSLQKGPGKALEEFLKTLKDPRTALKVLAGSAALAGTVGLGHGLGKNTADGIAKKIGGKERQA